MLLGIIVRKKPSSSLQKRSKSSSQHGTPEPVSKKSKKHSKDKSKKKHSKKPQETPYEEIIFGKHKPPTAEVKNAPSESSGAYTPPDYSSPPSSAATPTTEVKKELDDDAKLLLEIKLEKQKQELLRLQAEVSVVLNSSFLLTFNI